MPRISYHLLFLSAIRAGRDADGCNIFVGRAFHEQDLLPAKVIPDKHLAFVSFNGEEFEKSEYEVLRFGDFVWEFAQNGKIANVIDAII